MKAPRRRVDGPEDGDKKEGRSSASGQPKQRDKNNRRDIVGTPFHLDVYVGGLGVRDFMHGLVGLQL